MSLLIFKLNGVPEDEADEVRELLAVNEIHFYETSAGRWGLSMPGLWLSDESQLQLAQELLNEYQQQRFNRVREDRHQLMKEGKLQTLFDRIKDEPVRMICYLLVIMLIIYLSINPFLGLMG